MKIKKHLKNITVSGVKYVCGSIHLSSLYVCHAAEDIEAYTRKKLHGEIPKHVIDDRRKASLRKEKRQKDQLRKLYSHVKSIKLPSLEYELFNKTMS